MRRQQIALPAGVVAALAVTAAACFRREWTQLTLMVGGWVHAFQAMMAANWLVFGIGQTLIAASGLLPASMIAVMAGATLGLGWGLALSSLSTMLGGWLAFALSRSMLREWIGRRLRRYPTAIRWDEAVTSEGWRMVALLRISPVMPFALTSYGFGLTRISQRDFLIGTLASLPALAGYVAIGALGRQAMLTMVDGSGSYWRLVMLAAGTAIVFYAFYRVKSALNQTVAAG